MDYVDELEKFDCVWPYLKSITNLHRQRNAGDVLEQLATEIKLNWDQVPGASDLHDAVIQRRENSHIHIIRLSIFL